jgi:hypothetical protein
VLDLTSECWVLNYHLDDGRSNDPDLALDVRNAFGQILVGAVCLWRRRLRIVVSDWRQPVVPAGRDRDHPRDGDVCQMIYLAIGVLALLILSVSYSVKLPTEYENDEEAHWWWDIR